MAAKFPLVEGFQQHPTVSQLSLLFHSCGWVEIHNIYGYAPGFSLDCVPQHLILLWLQPAKRAKAYADAWRGLDDVYSRYLRDENLTADKVYDTRLKGEQLISFTDPG